MLLQKCRLNLRGLFIQIQRMLFLFTFYFAGLYSIILFFFFNHLIYVLNSQPLGKEISSRSTSTSPFREQRWYNKPFSHLWRSSSPWETGQ